MSRSTGSSRIINTNETPTTKKKSQTIQSSQKNKTSHIKENGNNTQKTSAYDDKYIDRQNQRPPKFGSPKDSLDDITNISLEASLSLASLKTYDYKQRNGLDNITLSDQEAFYENRKTLERTDLDIHAPLEDARMTSREIATMRRSLNEAQARAISATKELSKLQYEKSVVDNQLRKIDGKCKELIEQKAIDQARINELNYLNSQLNAEMVKLRIESQNSSGKTKENLEKLKKNLLDVEEAIEKKNQKAFKTLKKLKVLISAQEKLFEASAKSSFSKSRGSFEKIYEVVDKVSEIICAKSISDLKYIRDADEYEAIESLNDVISTYEKENTSLKADVSLLKEQLDKEQQKSRETIPQYKASVARLKKNTQLIRDKLKDIQEVRIKEKKEFEEKIQVLEENQKKLVVQNQTLKDLNKRLNTQLEESERLNTENTFKVKNLVMENARMSARTSIKPTFTEEPIESSKRKNKYRNVGYEPEQLSSEEEQNYREEIKRSSSKQRHNSTSKSTEGFSVHKKEGFLQDLESLKPKTRTEGVLSYRSSHKLGKTEEGWREYQGRKSFSAKKDLRENENQGDWENKMGKRIGWDDYEGQVEGRRTFGLHQKRHEEEIVENEEEEDNNHEDNDDNFKKYLGNEEENSVKNDENTSRPGLENLKDEIFSLDNEIYEIQKLIKEELES